MNEVQGCSFGQLAEHQTVNGSKAHAEEQSGFHAWARSKGIVYDSRTVRWSCTKRVSRLPACCRELAGCDRRGRDKAAIQYDRVITAEGCQPSATGSTLLIALLTRRHRR